MKVGKKGYKKAGIKRLTVLFKTKSKMKRSNDSGGHTIQQKQHSSRTSVSYQAKNNSQAKRGDMKWIKAVQVGSQQTKMEFVLMDEYGGFW